MPLPAIGFLLILLLLAAAELSVLIQVADVIGVLATILLLVGLGILGMALVRRQGVATLMRAHAAIEAGRPPVADLFDGACILVAGFLLLLPGLITDVLAGALLLPPVRRLLYKVLARRARVVAARTGPGEAPRRTGPAVIEGEYEEIEPVSDGSDERRPR